MQKGNENWKWGVVVLLLAIFLITANQAYQHLANQETFEPPDDYLKGDSWDLEHQNGPGAGQPMQLSTDNYSMPTAAPAANVASNESNNALTMPEPIVLDDDVDWSQSDEK